jgi:hypothetical protein
MPVQSALPPRSTFSRRLALNALLSAGLVAFLSFAAVLLGPVARRFLHRFHLEFYDWESDR